MSFDNDINTPLSYFRDFNVPPQTTTEKVVELPLKSKASLVMKLVLKDESSETSEEDFDGAIDTSASKELPPVSDRVSETITSKDPSEKLVSEPSLSRNTTTSISNELNNKNSGVTLREGCCPCLLENLDSTTSLLLQIYNEDRSRRNATTTTVSPNTEAPITVAAKSKRSVKQDASKSISKRKKRRNRKRRKKNPRPKRQRTNQIGILSQLDVCCLCNFLPEEDLTLLTAQNNDDASGNNFRNDSFPSSSTESTSTTTERIEMTSKIFPDDISSTTTKVTPPQSQKASSDASDEIDKFKDATTPITTLQGAL